MYIQGGIYCWIIHLIAVIYYTFWKSGEKWTNRNCISLTLQPRHGHEGQSVLLKGNITSTLKEAFEYIFKGHNFFSWIPFKKRSNFLFDSFRCYISMFFLPSSLIIWFMAHGKTFLENTNSNLMNHGSTFQGLNLRAVATDSVTMPMEQAVEFGCRQLRLACLKPGSHCTNWGRF